MLPHATGTKRALDPCRRTDALLVPGTGACRRKWPATGDLNRSFFGRTA